MKTVLCSVVLLLGLMTCKSQTLTRHFTVKDGLPSNSIYSYAEDTLGRIWVATENGLCRFNSYGIKVFTSLDGLNSNDVTGVFRDRNGTLWIECFGTWPCYWDGQQVVRVQEHRQIEGDVLETSGLYFDEWRQEAYLSVQTETKTCIYNLTSGDSFFVDAPYFALSLAYEYQGEMFYVISGSTFQKSGDRSTRMPEVPIKKIRPYHTRLFAKNKICQLTDEEIKIGTLRGHEIHTQLTIPNRWGVTNCTKDGDSIRFVKGNRVYRISKSGLELEYMHPSDIRKVFTDQSGNYWIATKNDGVHLKHQNAPVVIKELEENESFRNIELLQADVLVSSDHWVRSISSFEKPLVARNDERVHLSSASAFGVIATIGSGLYRIKPNQVSFHPTWPAANKCGLAISDSIVIVGQSNKFRSIPISDNSEEETLEQYYHAMQVGDTALENRIYKSYSEGAASIWNKRAKQILRLNDQICLLVGISKLAVFDLQKKKITRQIELEGLRQVAIANGHIFALMVDNSILVFNHSFKRMRTLELATQYGITQSVNKLRIAGDNLLLIATNSGWFGYNIDFNQWTLKEVHRPIRGGSGYNQNVIDLTALQDTMYYLTDHKLLKTALVPDSIQIKNIYCESIQASGQTLLRSNFGSIGRRTNDISLLIDIVSSKHLMNVPYQYKLKGLNNSWIKTSSSKLDFPNLPAGSYTLLVSPVTRWGTEAQKPYEVVRFRIKPFFYERGMFKVGVPILVILLILLISSKIQKRRNLKFQREQELSRRIAELELKSLRASMNPHFIFNSLNSIQNFYVKNDIRSANYFMSSFSRLIRKILNTSFSNDISLKKEIELITDYLELEKMRLKDRLRYEVKYDEEILELNINIPQMLIQPYVENAIIHGVGRSGFVGVYFKVVGQTLEVLIEDNGVGINHSLKHRSQESDMISIATKTETKRINLLNEYFVQDFSVDITDKSDVSGSNETGTKITLKIPLELKRS